MTFYSYFHIYPFFFFQIQYWQKQFCGTFYGLWKLTFHPLTHARSLDEKNNSVCRSDRWCKWWEDRASPWVSQLFLVSSLSVGRQQCWVHGWHWATDPRGRDWALSLQTWLLPRLAALQALKRKKRFEKQLTQIDGTLSTIEFQREALENSHTNTEVLKNMGYAAKAMKSVHDNMWVAWGSVGARNPLGAGRAGGWLGQEWAYPLEPFWTCRDGSLPQRMRRSDGGKKTKQKRMKTWRTFILPLRFPSRLTAHL